jgi:hypothetical protein
MMSSRQGIILGLLLICVSALLPARGNKEENAVVQKNNVPIKQENTVQEQLVRIVEATGIVRLVGSGPFPELVISGSDYQWVIRDERYKLNDFQHRTVTVEGEQTIVELRFANGEVAGIRRELRNIRIISVD